ncbi:arsinothricin resistance N-acetyltransferase ArsN1 family A [Xanthomonas sp. NCPPB 3005]|uniref:arsinothricin resistance N-acetyltransferase ArsN1 family A n=1 Tax=Xanthomonas sp. NCPPB 3005 TaxID=3240913 RepID=UPI00351266D7
MVAANNKQEGRCMPIRIATRDDAEAIAAIYNQGIAERRSTFETQPRGAEDIREKLGAQGLMPYLVATDADGTVLGWANISCYRPRACYAGIGEFSIYLERGSRGRGIGLELLGALIAEARRLGYWKLLSQIFPINAASRALCARCGFREVGIYEKHAQLEGEWLDVVIVERVIAENLTPERVLDITERASYRSGAC